jgi:hypothetical protein
VEALVRRGFQGFLAQTVKFGLLNIFGSLGQKPQIAETPAVVLALAAAVLLKEA